MDQFKKEDIFKDDLSELDESREVVDCLVQEYEAATQPNYLSWQGIYLIKILIFTYINFNFLFCSTKTRIVNYQLNRFITESLPL